jgi:hypothetical protein
MAVCVEESAEAVVSVDVQAGDLVRIDDWFGV